ncbi:MAG: Guanine nucleotide exchange factor lte1 [Claussenomyces sp. TS43310]|nr:MAG: Guanine nucleotide exchange factor lte1 [Claussenomyces sp. TS43310]
MDAKTPSRGTEPLTPESIRQRQRDRLTARGRIPRDSSSATQGREVRQGLRRKLRLSPAHPEDPRGQISPENDQRRDGIRAEDTGTQDSRRTVGEGKVDITPGSTSIGRGGRQFAVANVGNNGKIYLRPSVRPATQRYPPPAFVFPITPPSTTGFETSSSRTGEQGSCRESIWTATPSSPTTPVQRAAGQGSFANSKYRPERRRALSQSTLDEYTPMQDSDVGALKVVIDRPGAEGRPKTAEEIGSVPTLQVRIPSHKLGTPRFSARGTAILRNSSYTTDDIRSSVFSQTHRDPSTARSTLRPDIELIRRYSCASSRPRCCRSEQSHALGTTSLPCPSIISPCGPISPAMFDELTFKPACDSRSLVRYAIGGGITAATPPRLVAEITSPSFLDYDLLSDFFLTFRSFLTASDLLAMLVARLRWALAREDAIGMIVRVRAFVAIRHWLLNYFMDDFVVDYELRKSFCELINDFVHELLQNPAIEKNKLKILAELKKCWRRTCALYWDGAEFSANVEPNAPIAPGGIAGSRDPHLNPDFWDFQVDVDPPRLDSVFEYDNTRGGYNLFELVSGAGHEESATSLRMTAKVDGPYESSNTPQSPGSILSEEAFSCSFPTKSKTAQQTGEPALGAHPVALPTSSWFETCPPVAHTPKGINVKRRPTQTHKRSGSFSDSLRDGRGQEPVRTVVYRNTELLMSLPYAGSLVRGNLIPPGHPFVDVVAPATPAEMMRQLASPVPSGTNQKAPSAMSGPGMKKLIGSVRRALGNVTGSSPSASPTQGSFPHIPPLGVRSATINRLPGTAIVPQARSRDAEGRVPARIDLLGAGVAEDFKKAVREDAEADARRQDQHLGGSIGIASGNEAVYPLVRSSGNFEPPSSLIPRSRLSGITGGSQSIVIVDDTVPFELPIMVSELQQPSTDTITDAVIRATGPTPPSTPPNHHIAFSRPSSHVLGQGRSIHSRSLSLDRTPSLVNDNRDQSTIDRSPSSRQVLRPSMLSYGRSNKSSSLRRYASYQSNFTRHMTEQSFDATTLSDAEDLESNGTSPAPPHVLRRRPGGNLRAVTKVGDLNSLPLRRTQSFDSVTRTDSLRSSYLIGINSSSYIGRPTSKGPSQDNTGVFSLGALAAATSKPKLSLYSTDLSKPAMRPSFEAEAAKLAQIPDDDDDDGGVESALLKLEGKFDGHRRSQTHAVATSPDASFSLDAAGVNSLTREASYHDGDEKRKHRQKRVLETSISMTPPVLDAPEQETSEYIEELKPTVYQPQQSHVPIQSLQSNRSADSDSSIPILQRDLSDDGYVRMDRRNWNNTSILRDDSERRKTLEELAPESSRQSVCFIDDSSLREVPLSKVTDKSGSVVASFLESDSDGESDLSSELSLQIISRTEVTANDEPTFTFPPNRPGTVITEIALPPHPLRQPSWTSMSIGQALSLGPHQQRDAPQLYADQLDFQPAGTFPPTPEVTPTVPSAKPSSPVRQWHDGGQDPRVRTSINPSEASRKTSAHLPFILAFDSKILAEQFTLIEKDALAEIDWKELIDMRWKNTSTTTRSWVDFLRTQEARGVEVVIARFNIMVKWAVSECVLTENLHERVQTVIKYIHIAAECRRYRNYATMYQLTVALTSSDLARLSQTWALVPAADQATLKELETLVQPTRNFYNLRAEMECGGVDNGCIPFVGIYTQDLLFNSQRPSQIASTPTTEPLVNFERCRTMAAVVKNLLRLLEASSLYRFQPIEGITERCLWMAALNDEEIRRCGKMLEECQ